MSASLDGGTQMEEVRPPTFISNKKRRANVRSVQLQQNQVNEGSSDIAPTEGAAGSLGMSFMCRIMGHHRAGTQAYFDPQIHRWRSICHRCGVAMIRERKSKWHPTTD